MIISDADRAVFIHIPKSAGTSTRKQLAPADSTNGFFWGVKPVIGHAKVADHAHLTLAQLRAWYPETADKLRSYCTIALIRDPVPRFWSGIVERLRLQREYKMVPTIAEIRKEAAAVLSLKSPWEIDCSFVHLTPQYLYVCEDEKQVASDLFAIEQLEAACARLSKMFRIPVSPDIRENQRRAYRSRIAKVPVIEYFLLNTGRHPLQRPVSRAAKRLLLTTGAYADPALTPAIQRAYARDVDLYREVADKGLPA